MLASYIAAIVILFMSRSLTHGIGYRSVGVNALTLNANESRLWEENSSMIHGIAQQRLCKDGSAPTLERIQLDGELTTYELRCDDRSWRNASTDAVDLHKRQTTYLCTTSCTHDCYSTVRLPMIKFPVLITYAARLHPRCSRLHSPQREAEVQESVVCSRNETLLIV